MARPRKISQDPLPSGFSTPEEVAAVVSLCIQFEQHDSLIVDEFSKIFSRSISLAAVNRVRELYADQIRQRQLALLEDFERTCPFSTSRSILRLASHLYRKVTDGSLVVKTYRKAGSAEVTEVKGTNLDVAVQLLKLGHRINEDLRAHKDPTAEWDTSDTAEDDDDDQIYAL
jgi:hypothetical protein